MEISNLQANILKFKLRENIWNTKKLWIKSLCINAIVLFVLLFFFEPTTKSDDYDMVNLLCGGIDGNNSAYLLYSHYFYGMILKILTDLFPHISWYFIIQYILLYLGFSVLCYVSLEINKGKHIWLFLIFMLYAGYEFYIRITFSKTAGILIGIGYLWILYLIESRNKIGLSYMLGVVLVIIGTLIRGGMFLIITAIFFSTFIIFCIKEFKSKYSIKDIMRKLSLFVICVCWLFIIYELLGALNVKAFSLDKKWDKYFEVNTTRSALFDYEIPDYYVFQEEYSKIGISENDYRMWFGLANGGDSEILTPEKIEAISGIEMKESDELNIQIIDGLREVLQYQFGNPMFFLLFSCAIILLGCEGSFSILIILLVEGICVFSYMYLYIMGRLQHHVDAAFYATGAMILLYYCKLSDKKIQRKQKVVLPLSIVFILSINLFYDGIVSSSYYGKSFGDIISQKQQYSENYEKLDLLSDDKGALYLIGAMETNILYPCFTVFEPIEKNFYSNIYRTNMNHIEIFESALHNYNIKNPWRECVDSNYIYYVVSEKNRSDLETILKYIQENYSSAALYTLVKQIDDMYIYRFHSGEIVLEKSEMKKINANVKYSVDMKKMGEGKVLFSGFVFETDTDSFTQNVYIEVENKHTGKSSYTMSFQMQNQEFYSQGKMKGEYSGFEAEVYIGDTILSEMSLYLILENENGLYRIPVKCEI